MAGREIYVPYLLLLDNMELMITMFHLHWVHRLDPHHPHLGALLV